MTIHIDKLYPYSNEMLNGRESYRFFKYYVFDGHVTLISERMSNFKQVIGHKLIPWGDLNYKVYYDQDELKKLYYKQKELFNKNRGVFKFNESTLFDAFKNLDADTDLIRKGRSPILDRLRRDEGM